MGKYHYFYCGLLLVLPHLSTRNGVELDRVWGDAMFAQVPGVQRLNIRMIQLCLVFSPLSMVMVETC